MTTSTPAKTAGFGQIEQPLNHAGFRAMGCEFNIWLAAQPEIAATRLAVAQAWIHTVEAALSRFRENSELMRLNARAGQPVTVSPLLWRVLTEAINAAQATGGLVDPMVLPSLILAGYDRSFERMPARSDQPGNRPMAEPSGASWQDVVLEPVSRTVTLPPGAAIDLGGIAKGWVADRVTANLAAVGPALVDAGGDISARGSPPGQTGWRIGVQDPFDSSDDVAILQVCDLGVATSGTDYRRWRRGGREYHHIIDPTTGVPAETDLLTATVIAPTAADADVQALVVILLGARAGLDHIEAMPATEALVIDRTGKALRSSGFSSYVDSGD